MRFMFGRVFDGMVRFDIFGRIAISSTMSWSFAERSDTRWDRMHDMCFDASIRLACGVGIGRHSSDGEQINSTEARRPANCYDPSIFAEPNPWTPNHARQMARHFGRSGEHRADHGAGSVR